MHFNGRLSAPFRKVLLSSPHPSCSRPGAPQPHPKISPPLPAGPGAPGRLLRDWQRPQGALCQPAPQPAPAAARPASLLFHPRTYLLSKHFRRSLPRLFFFFFDLSCWRLAAGPIGVCVGCIQSRIHPCAQPERPRARGHIPGSGEITAAWLLPSSCHHLFPPRPPPAVPVTGRARRARRMCRAGLQRGAGLHCDAGRLSPHLLFSRLLERVCLQTIPL